MSSRAASLASDLAVHLPAADLRELSEAAAQGLPGLSGLRARSSAGVVRDACDQLMTALGSCAPGYLAGALAGVAELASAERRSGTVDIVWTGPSSDLRTSRLTAAVVVDLIAEARAEVLLVSFAAHTEPTIGGALHEAAGRGVTVTLLLERRDDNPAFSGQDLPFPALPARRLRWPASARPSGAALHAKVLVVDAAVALVGSANLTSRALEHNLECGVLLRGGTAPATIRRHLLRLEEARVLRDIAQDGA